MEPAEILIAIVAVAVVMQAVALILLSLAVRRVSERIDNLGRDLSKRMESLSEDAHEAFASIKALVAGMEVIRENVAQTTAVIRGRASELDAFLEETTRSARLQVVAVQEFLDGALQQFEETFDAVQKGVLNPIRDLSALIIGIKTGIDALFGRRRRGIDRFQHDDEMFI